MSYQKEELHLKSKVLFFTLLSCLSFASDVHTVRQGDSLMTISNQYYGTHQCWQLIKKSNPQLINDQISVGHIINIPSSAGCLKAKKIKMASSQKTIKLSPVREQIRKTEVSEMIIYDENKKVILN